MYNFFTELMLFSYNNYYFVLDRHLSEDGCTPENVDTGILLDPAVSSGDFKRVMELKKQRQLYNQQ